MNIHLKDDKIVQDLENSSLIKVKVGSSLYGLDNHNSDTDILNITAESLSNQHSFVWTHHQLQFKKDNTDYLYCNLRNFIRNILSGDSTINYEVLFSKEFQNDKFFSFLYDMRHSFNSYQILKSYLGLARRDLKNFKKENNVKKLHHALRGIWSFEQIVNNVYTNDIQTVDIETYTLLLNVKNNILSEKDCQNLYSSLTEKIEKYRVTLNDEFNNKNIVRIMKISDMVNLDVWLMEFCQSNNYKSKQSKSKNIILDIYDSLQNDVKYSND